MSYLFDTDAISEVLRPRPNERYLAWLRKVPATEQMARLICSSGDAAEPARRLRCLPDGGIVLARELFLRDRVGVMAD